MDARRILVGAAVAAGIAISGAGSGAGAEGVGRLDGGGSFDCVPVEKIFDDFADGNVFDGVPVQWVMSACCPGQFPPAEGGGVEVRPPGDLSTSFRTEGVLAGDISVRIRGSFNGTLDVINPNGVRPTFAAFVHANQVESTLLGYQGGVYRDGQIGIFKYSEWRMLKEGQLDFDPKDGDLYVELSRRGNSLELRVWRADDAGPDVGRPETAQLDCIDGDHTAGYSGFQGWFGAGNPIILRSIRIAKEECPAPGPFLRGDANDDGTVDISDAVKILKCLFLLDSLELGCKAAANVDGDEAADGNSIVDISDPVYLLNFLFLGTPAPPPPYPYCGPGNMPSDKALGCETPPASCQ